MIIPSTAKHQKAPAYNLYLLYIPHILSVIVQALPIQLYHSFCKTAIITFVLSLTAMHCALLAAERDAIAAHTLIFVPSKLGIISFLRDLPQRFVCHCPSFATLNSMANALIKAYALYIDIKAKHQGQKHAPIYSHAAFYFLWNVNIDSAYIIKKWENNWYHIPGLHTVNII